MAEFMKLYGGPDEAIQDIIEIAPWIREELEERYAASITLRYIKSLGGEPHVAVAVSVGPAVAVTPAEMSAAVAEVARLRAEVDQLLGR